MPEVIHNQPASFEYNTSYDPLSEYDNNQEFVNLYLNLAEKFHLSPELARIGAAWGVDWQKILQTTATYTEDNSQIQWTAECLQTARDSAALALPIPRDTTEGKPTFRVQFAAHEAFYALAGTNGELYRKTLEGNGPRIVPNFEQIDHVFITLLDSYHRKLYPYNLDSTRVPQDPRHMPRNLQTDIEKCDEQQKIQLASFWFADCYYMRGVNDSNDMTINLSKLHEHHPEVFDFHYAMEQQPDYIEQLLLDYHLPVQHKQISRAWVENARRMVERYNGNPNVIFENFSTYENLVKRIANDHKGGGFIGFQKKMVSMLGYFYMTNGLTPYQNIPLPVDFHVMRMAISQQLITFEGMQSNVVPFEKTTDFLRSITFDFADHHSISQLDLCDVVWSYSREACVNSPTNSQNIIGRRQGRKTAWAPALTNAKEATSKQLSNYQQSCGICRLKNSCVHNVPSGRYYVSGEILWPDPKIHLDHPQSDLHHNGTLEDAQRPVLTPAAHHAIDLRDQYREQIAARRRAAIRTLAQSALFPLSPQEESAIATAMATTNGNPATSLSGKKIGFTNDEITQALGANPSPDELSAIRPYQIE